jgi:hypothetical protein
MTAIAKSACCLSKRRSMIRVGREPHAVFSNRSRAPSLPLLIKTPMEVPNCQPRKGPLPDDDDMDNDDDDLSVYRKSSRRRNTAFHSTIDDSMRSACKHVAHKTTTTAFNQQTSLVHDQTSLQPRHDQTKPYSSVLHIGFEHNKTLHNTCRPWDDHSKMHALPLRCRYSIERILLPVVVYVLYSDVCARQCLLFNVPSRYFRDVLFISFHSSLLILASKRTVSIRLIKLNHCTLSMRK